VHLLRERDAEEVRKRLAAVARPVRLVYFTEGRSGLVIPGRECPYCAETQRLLEDLAACSDRLTLEVHDRFSDPAPFAAFGITRVPGLAVVAGEDRGVRYYGFPGGYELATLLDIIADAAGAGTPLSQETEAALAALAADVHLQVFVTPT
jgi:alkyl hydroperoxide reductase subunit AhpF